MTDSEQSRLVLRRTTAKKGNRIAIRLSPDFDRASDPYELFREGFVVEVDDVEDAQEEGEYVVTLGLLASKSFKIDRLEAACLPRSVSAVGREDTVFVKYLSHDELRALPLEEIERYEHTLIDAEAKLLGQKARSKLDRGRASERGWNRDMNDNYARWIMISDEMASLDEQLSNIRNAKTKALSARKAALVEINEKQRTLIQDNFLRLCREELDPELFKKFKSKAEAMANSQA